MRQTGFFHHIGTLLLLAATVLLIITDISAPVVNDISILRVELNGNNRGSLSSSFDDSSSRITFGTFGYCLQDTTGNGDDACSRSQVGYDPAAVVTSQVQSVDFSSNAATALRALTRVMILHPIATGLAFIAFLLALGAGVLGGLLASLVSLLTFLVTLVALVCDFVAFGIVRNEVNDLFDDDDNNGTAAASAHWGPAAWTLLASAICSFLATFVVFFTCCSARIHRRREARGVAKAEGYVPPPTTRRRRWF
ncbi:pali-domain-containing protein [Xylariaceae sp. FL0662B]|nr:pali-domain-containing protein [Xylariaceae sp. FL0662B]